MKISLIDISAKHIHKSLAPWCLKAYCDENVEGCHIAVQEHTINDNPASIVRDIYRNAPDIVGFSCYIWNIEHVVKVANMLEKCLPKSIIILGGPEVSFETSPDVYPFADYIIQGAGEASLAKIITNIINGNTTHDVIIRSENPIPFANLPSPYTDEYFQSFKNGKGIPIEHQLVYYESTRGCPFSCTYCLSSATCGVEELPLRRVMADLHKLVEHGAKCIKFVDRTFNANKKRAVDILEYVLSLDTDCTFHFEAAADLFDAKMLQVISRMPPRRVQFEIGIQSVKEDTLAAIHRITNIDFVLENIKKLVAMGNCHVHVDLIAGLPHETLASFSKGIDQCIDAGPHMLQLGFLKMLKGTKIRENSTEHEYIYNDFTPYEVLQNNSMCFADMIILKNVEQTIDKFYNSGMFVNTIRYAVETIFGSAYQCFYHLSEFCGKHDFKTSLKNAYTLLYNFLCRHTNQETAAHYIKLDCLTFDVKGMLPDAIIPHRFRTLENAFKRKSPGKYKNVRIEYFPLDNKTRAFLYDEKDPIKKSHKIIILQETDLRG